MDTVFTIIFSAIILGQFLYIVRLRRAIDYAARVLAKYEKALLMDDIIRKVHENESKTSKDVSE